MSDESRGPGWWLASDGKWYPPESRPSALPPPAPPTATASQSVSAAKPQWTNQRKAAIVSASLIVVGAFLPWAQTTIGLGTLTKTGLEGDGLFTMILGVGAGIAIVDGKRRSLRVAAALAAVAAAIGVWDAQDIVNNAEGIEVGAGLILTIAAAIGVVLFAMAATNGGARVVFGEDGAKRVNDGER